MTPNPHPPAPPPPDAPLILAPRGDPAESEAAFLLRYLHANEAPCPSCGYNLHALTHPRCPECGQAIRVRVALRVPPVRAWLVMAAATCASAGLGIVFAAMDAPERFTRAAYVAILFFYAAIPSPPASYSAADGSSAARQPSSESSPQFWRPSPPSR